MTSPVLCNINAAIWHPMSWACLGLRDLLKRRGGVVGIHFYVPTLLMTMPDSFRTEGRAGGGSSLSSRMVLGMADVYLLNFPFVGYAVGSSEPPSPSPHTHQGCPHLHSLLHLYRAPDSLTLRTATVFSREPGSEWGRLPQCGICLSYSTLTL